MNLFEKMCQACDRCKNTKIDECFLVEDSYKKDIKETLLLEEDPNDYALCERCIHYQGGHSSIFGECWTCNKNVQGRIEDNDWHKERNEPIIPCSEYVFGIPHDYYFG